MSLFGNNGAVLIGETFVRRETRVTAPKVVRDDWLHTDQEHEALGALEATARYLEAVESDPDNWKWVIIALHNAVQGFMVLTLRGSQSWGALRDTDIAEKVQAERDYYRASEADDIAAAEAANQIMLFSPSKLADFITLYTRIKRDKWPMKQYTNSTPYPPRPTDARCMHNLNSIRNEFSHFLPSGRLFLLSQFPAITATGLYVIDFLVKESNNFPLHSTEADTRFETAMA